jgi:hypothetical protein
MTVIGCTEFSEREGILFGEWAACCDARFVLDGVIGEYGEWCSHSPKILFLAKEAHDNKGVLGDVDYDVRAIFRRWEHFAYGNSKKIDPILPRNCGYWAFALEKWWKDNSEICEELPTSVAACNAAFQRTALVNLKKTAGGKFAEPSQIAQSASEHRKFIKRQLELLDADITVCCGDVVFEIAESLLGSFESQNSSGRLFKRSGKVWINQWHPSYMRSDLQKLHRLNGALTGDPGNPPLFNARDPRPAFPTTMTKHTYRAYWERKASPNSMALADEVLGIIRSFAPPTEWNYRMFHIGLSENGKINNYAWCNPRRNRPNLSIRLAQSPETARELVDSGLDLLPYDSRNKAYGIGLEAADVEQHRVLILNVLKTARDRSLS